MEIPIAQSGLYLVAAAAIFGIAIYGLLIAEHLLRKLFALNLMASAVFLLLVALGGTIDGAPDPVPQALVLTGIVVTVSVTAFALALLVRLFRETGQPFLDDADADAGDKQESHAESGKKT